MYWICSRDDTITNEANSKRSQKEIFLPENERGPSATGWKSQLLLQGSGSRRGIGNRMVWLCFVDRSSSWLKWIVRTKNLLQNKKQISLRGCQSLQSFISTTSCLLSSKITLPTMIIVFIFFSIYRSINMHDCLLIISLDLTWTLPSKWHLRNLGGGVLCHWYLASTGSPFCYFSAGHGNVGPLHRSAVARHGEL